MGNRGILFGTADPVTQSLETLLERDFQLQLTCTTSPCVVFSELDADPATPIFLDLRPDAHAAGAGELLDACEQRESVNLVVISEDALPLHLARQACLLSLAHVDLRRDASAARQALNRLSDVRVRPRPVPTLQSVHAGDVSVSTYTDALQNVLEQLVRVARHPVTLLLVGETGTGKTTLARLIHNLSPRRDRPFQHLACGALPRDLIESELFGHTRGAFTGADRMKIGRFEAAGNGTLLLDEIDMLGKNEQAKLLKVIETGEYERVGSTETQRSQARLVVASNRELESLTREDVFRADLYYRLSVLESRLPPLRERPLDIIPLALDFVAGFCREFGIEINTVQWTFLESLESYHWPGNVRELKNRMQRAVLFGEDQKLTTDGLSEAILESRDRRVTTADGRTGTLADRIASNERRIVEAALREHNDCRTAAAKALGISRVGLYKKMRRLGLVQQKSHRVTSGAQ